MGKIVRLSEEDMMRLVKKVLKEQGNVNNPAQQMIDSWNKIIKPKLKENGWSEGHGKYRMVKKHPYDKWIIHCVLIPEVGKRIGPKIPSISHLGFSVYRVENEFDVPTMKQSLDFKPPKCGTIEQCAKRTLESALKNAGDL